MGKGASKLSGNSKDEAVHVDGASARLAVDSDDRELPREMRQEMADRLLLAPLNMSHTR